MLSTIKNVFRKKSSNGNKIIINCENLETRVALIENGILEEYNIERKDEDNIVGNVYLGRVKNIENGLKAMFVDIGYEKNAFLHFWDAIPGALDSGLEEIKRKNNNRNQAHSKNKRLTINDIPKIYPVGSEVLVQVTKGAISNKGPRITTRISLAGRFLVMMPLNEQFGISRKVDNQKERVRLKKILEKMTIPENMGVIMRTACQGQRARFFIRDFRILLEKWYEIDENRKNNKAPACVFNEPNIIERTVRDFLTDEIEEVICDDIDQVTRMKKFASHISKRAKNRINHYPYQDPILIRYGVQKQIDNAFLRQVWLPCGGYIVIDETEAMIAVDVNTGRNKGSRNVDKMIYETNLEAAYEVARQLRLRNIGGLVVIDFIDMKSRRDQNLIYKAIKEKLERDKAKSQVMQISPLGLMEMTRQRLNESLVETLYDVCEFCNGKGKVKSTTTMSIEIQHKIKVAMTRYKSRHKELVIVVHPDVIHRLKTEDDKHLADLQRKLEGRLIFRSDPSFHREEILITDSNTGEEIKL